MPPFFIEFFFSSVTTSADDTNVSGIVEANEAIQMFIFASISEKSNFFSIAKKFI